MQQEALQSRRYELFRRLGDKLLLESGEARGFPPLVSREIVAVIDASALLLDQVIVQENVGLEVTIDTYVIAHTVPIGERWHLISINREGTAANTHVEVNISVADINHVLSNDGTTFEILDVQGIKLQENDTIGMVATGNGGDTAIFVNVIYDRELVGSP